LSVDFIAYANAGRFEMQRAQAGLATAATNQMKYDPIDTIVYTLNGNLNWDSSENRSYGDDAPNIKLEFDNPNERDELLKHSVIDSSQIENWQICSGEKDKGRSWNEKRVQVFQQAVEQRAFTLYERFYNELGFSEWIEKLPEKTKPEQE
jgi:hypothetical protein